MTRLLETEFKSLLLRISTAEFNYTTNERRSVMITGPSLYLRGNIFCVIKARYLNQIGL
jgi:hypothetical protein